MDNSKRALILDGATDLYTLIRSTLGLSTEDQRVTDLNAATERYLRDVLALGDGSEAGGGLQSP